MKSGKAESLSIECLIEDLRQKNRDLKSILDNMPSMIGYWDRNCINRFGNYAYRIWFGIDPETMPGRHIREVIGEDRYKLNLPYIEAALAGQFQSFERMIPLPDGEIRHSLANYIPDIVDGQVQGFYVLVSDITPLKRAQSELRASEERYRAVVEDQTEAISRFRPDGSLVFVNDVYSRVFAKTRRELLLGSWMPVAHPDDLPMVERRLKELTPANPLVVIENRVYSGQGRLMWMQFVNRGFFDQSGMLREIQSVGRDITERKQAEESLAQARAELERRVEERTEQLRQISLQLAFVEERERQSIARDLHDELGQVLHVIKLKLDRLSKDGIPDTLIQDLHGLVADASRQVRTLTSQLSPPVLLSLGLGPALHTLGDELLQRYQLKVICHIEAGTPPINQTQAAILYRAARELLINAAKHSGTNLAVLTMQQSADTLCISVSDQGRGMNVNQIPAQEAGGFGLASVRERIQSLGGRIQFESADGDGCCITMCIPLKNITTVNV